MRLRSSCERARTASTFGRVTCTMLQPITRRRLSGEGEPDRQNSSAKGARPANKIGSARAKGGRFAEKNQKTSAVKTARIGNLSFPQLLTFADLEAAKLPNTAGNGQLRPPHCRRLLGGSCAKGTMRTPTKPREVIPSSPHLGPLGIRLEICGTT